MNDTENGAVNKPMLQKSNNQKNQTLVIEFVIHNSQDLFMYSISFFLLCFIIYILYNILTVCINTSYYHLKTRGNKTYY